ncbi:Mechanosensitive ion channel [Spraguea lophii 42_110]|uniref:Mechanosensitive ion channel n=1 Tax=Spraguea lophii (strain 42_110) TaxID=1358809 RepID=S7XV86_SPRLO|nr:Mechanosensitive ion channel [Spraguea lophii 42_110]
MIIKSKRRNSDLSSGDCKDKKDDSQSGEGESDASIFGEVDDKSVDVNIDWKERMQIIILCIFKFRYILEITIFLILFSISFKRDIYYTYLNSEKVQTVRELIIIIYICLTTHVVVDALFYGVANIILSITSKLADLCMYITVLSSPGSSILALTLFYFIQTKKYGELYILGLVDEGFTLQKIILWLIFVFFLISLKNISFQIIRIVYNYSAYLKRIRKCLLDFLVIKMLKIVDSNEHITWERVNPKNWISFFKLKDMNNGKKQLSDNKLKILTGPATADKDRIMIMREFNILTARETQSLEDPLKNKTVFQTLIRRKAKRLCRQFEERSVYKYSHIAVFFEEYDSYADIMEVVGIPPRGAIKYSEIHTLLERSYNEKIFLKKSLLQINGAINRVETSTSAIIFILSILSLLVIRFDISSSLAAFFSAIFGTNFVLIALTTDLMNGLIFLFGVHPFDIGDRIFVELEGNVENLIVKELNVLSTVFYNFEGVLVTVPNSQLIEKMITNVRRCGNMAESHPFAVDVNTDVDTLMQLKKKIKYWLRENNRLFTDVFMLNLEKIDDGNKLIIKIYIQYIKNWQNYEFFLERRTLFMLFITEAMKELGIRYRPLTQRVELIPSDINYTKK